jgi:hypothetical protein
MRSSRLAISVLMVASLFAATAIAPAQAQRGPGTSNKDITGAKATKATKSNKTPGITTGSASTAKPRTQKGVLPNPPMQNGQDSGAGRGK